MKTGRCGFWYMCSDITICPQQKQLKNYLTVFTFLKCNMLKPINNFYNLLISREVDGNKCRAAQWTLGKDMVVKVTRRSLSDEVLVFMVFAASFCLEQS